MVQNVLRQIGGVGIYGVFSVVLFFAVFTIAVVWTFMHRRPFLQHMSALPLEEEGVKGDTSHE